MAIAPVKAPFSCPNISLSHRLSAMAEQLTAIKGLSFRALLWWIALAINSFPVPVSPTISTVALVGATISISS